MTEPKVKNKGRAARRKGHQFERDVANAINEALPGSLAKRGLAQTRGGGAESSDVVLEGYHVECKRHKRVGIGAAWRQAQQDSAGTANEPIVIHKDDREETLVTMTLDHWLELLQQQT